MTAEVGAYGNGSLVIGAMLCARYRIDDFLGVGGMGVVVAATDTHAPPNSPFLRVALKLLRDELVSKAHIVERFLREARAVLRLSTEHVCKVLDIARLPSGAPVIVMERLDGMDLARTTQRQALPSSIAVEYVMQACVALAEAHAKGVVHRDLKPANLFVIRRPDGGPMIKVLDFGIAKALFETDAALTRTRMVMGSPGYMSPEQIESAKDVDSRTDIWALGATLYQLLSKRLPFPGRNAMEIAVRVASDAPDPLEAEPAIVATVMRCLAKRPGDRFGDVVALANELAPFGGPSGRYIAAMVAEASRRGPSGSVSAQLGTPSAQLGTPSAAREVVQFDQTMPSGFVAAQPAPPSGFVQAQPNPPSGFVQAQPNPSSPNPPSGFVQAQPAPPSGFVQAQPNPSSGFVPAQPAPSGFVPAPHPNTPHANQAAPHANRAAAQHANDSTAQHANNSAAQHANQAAAQHANDSAAQHANDATAVRRRRRLYAGIAIAVAINAIIIAVALSRTSSRNGDHRGSNLAADDSSAPGSNGTPGSDDTPGSNRGPNHGSKMPGSSSGPGSNREPGSNTGPGSNREPGSAVDPWGPDAHRPSETPSDGDDDGSDDVDSVNGALETLGGPDKGDDDGDRPDAAKAPAAKPRGNRHDVATPIDTSKLPNVPGMTKQQVQQSLQQAAVACKQLLDGKMPVAVPIEAQASCACVIRDSARAQALVDRAPDSKKPTLKRMCAQFGVSLR